MNQPATIIQATSANERQKSATLLAMSLNPAASQDRPAMVVKMELNLALTLCNQTTLVETMAVTNINHIVALHTARVMDKIHRKAIHMPTQHLTSKVINLALADHRAHKALSHGVSSRLCNHMVSSHHLVKDIQVKDIPVRVTLDRTTISRTNTGRAVTATAKDHDTDATVTGIRISPDKMMGENAC